MPGHAPEPASSGKGNTAVGGSQAASPLPPSQRPAPASAGAVRIPTLPIPSGINQSRAAAPSPRLPSSTGSNRSTPNSARRPSKSSSSREDGHLALPPPDVRGDAQGRAGENAHVGSLSARSTDTQVRIIDLVIAAQIMVMYMCLLDLCCSLLAW